MWIRRTQSKEYRPLHKNEKKEWIKPKGREHVIEDANNVELKKETTHLVNKYNQQNNNLKVTHCFTQDVKMC